MASPPQELRDGGGAGPPQETPPSDKTLSGGEQASTDAAKDESAPAPARNVTMCGVCNREVGKYKCSRCPVAYCSAACSVAHRESDPLRHGETALPKPPAPTPAPAAAPTPEPANNHPFRVLDDAPELNMLFAKYPRLKRLLCRITDATLPPKDGESGAAAAAAAPTRGGLPWKHHGGSRGGGGGRFNKKEAWTHDVGLRRGCEALRRARAMPGEDGEGVREYCELALHLLSRTESENEEAAARGVADATALVRQEVAREDAKLVEQLIQAEEQ